MRVKKLTIISVIGALVVGFAMGRLSRHAMKNSAHMRSEPCGVKSLKWVGATSIRWTPISREKFRAFRNGEYSELPNGSD